MHSQGETSAHNAFAESGTMTSEQAAALEQFIKDHDTRFLAKAVTDGDDVRVELTKPQDGANVEPVRSLDEYSSRYVYSGDPGPTIREAWEKWIAPRR